MGWIDFAWPMIGTASLTLGLVFLLAWSRQPRRYGYAMFFLAYIGVAAGLRVLDRYGEALAALAEMVRG